MHDLMHREQVKTEKHLVKSLALKKTASPDHKRIKEPYFAESKNLHFC